MKQALAGSLGDECQAVRQHGYGNGDGYGYGNGDGYGYGNGYGW